MNGITAYTCGRAFPAAIRTVHLNVHIIILLLVIQHIPIIRPNNPIPDDD